MIDNLIKILYNSFWTGFVCGIIFIMLWLFIVVKSAKKITKDWEYPPSNKEWQNNYKKENDNP